jgi:hypothetical protein
MRLVDLPNIERVLDGSGPADVVVLKADSHRISGLEWAADWVCPNSGARAS